MRVKQTKITNYFQPKSKIFKKKKINILMSLKNLSIK